MNSPYVSVLEFMTNGNVVNTGNATIEVGGVACSGAVAAVRRASGTRSGGAGRSAVRQAPSDHPQQVHRGLRAVCPCVPRCVLRATTCSQLWSARAVPWAGWARVRH